MDVKGRAALDNVIVNAMLKTIVSCVGRVNPCHGYF